MCPTVSQQKLSLILLIICFYFGVSAACSSAPSTPTVTDSTQDVKVHVTFSSNGLNWDHIKRPHRFDSMPRGTTETNRTNFCSNLLPGANIMTHGVNLFYFAMNSSDVSPVTSPWTKLTCPESRRQINRGYDFPLEFESMMINPDHKYKEFHAWGAKLNMKYIEQNFQEGVFGEYLDEKESHHLALATSNHAKTTIIVYIFTQFGIKLKGDVTPTRDIQKAWDDLPMPYESNQPVWHKFIKEYGTHVLPNVHSGGKLLMSLVYSKDNENEGKNDLSDIIVRNGVPLSVFLRSNPHLRAHIVDKLFYVRGGKFSTESTLREWADSVELRPTVVSAIKIPFQEVLEKTITDKYVNFESALRAEQGHHELRQYRTLIKNTQPDGDLRHFLLKLIDRELRFITPDTSYLKMMKSIAELRKDFSEYGIWLTSKPEEKNYKRITINYYVPIMINVCTTVRDFNSRLAHDIKSASWLIPSSRGSHHCIEAFEKKECEGNKIQFSDPDAMVSYGKVFRSFKMC